MVKKVRQVLERKTETVTSTFATRMLYIDHCVIQILPDIIIREQQLDPVWYCYTHKKMELTVNCMKNSAFCFFNFMIESDKLHSCMKLMTPKHSMSQ
jgi:hypothetical protein